MKSQIHIPQWAELIGQSLLQSLKKRDPYTYGHCRRVARNAKLLAQAAGLNLEQQTVIEYASLFHDLGKIGIPDRVLLKPEQLNASEEAIMREHPLKSVEIIQPLLALPFFNATVPGIRHHHERVDGSGYPDGMHGEYIPLHARIILIADTFDAMTTTRPYRRGRAAEFAYKELMQFSGRQFDPHLVSIFLKAHPTWNELEEDITEQFVSEHFRRAA